MSKTILQVPVNLQLKNDAENAATAQGFSSLQEAVRLFLNKLAQGAMQITFEETVHLSKKAEKRYDQIFDEAKNDKNIHEAKNVKDLMKQLHNAA